MKIIDPHLHFFDLNKGQYQWLNSQNPPFWPDKHLIARSVTEADLSLHSPLTLAGFVHIEAGFDNQQPWREIAWLEQTCQKNFRSIALLDITLAPDEFCIQLNQLLSFKSIVGIRYILDEQALAILQHKYCINNLKRLAAHQLCFELQLSLLDSHAVNYLIKNILTINNLRFCINHAGFPPIVLDSNTKDSNTKDSNTSASYTIENSVINSVWKDNLDRLSQFKNLSIKCSGYELFEKDCARAFSRFTSRKARQDIIQHCINSFGISRVMLASNFPLSTWQESYHSTWQTHISLAFSTNELEQLCYYNAVSFYRF